MNRLVILVQRRALHFHDCLVRFRARRNDLQYLALNVQSISGTGRLGPCQIAAQADNAVAQRQTTIYEKAHGYSGGVPPAGGQSGKHAGFRGGLIKMERLRIKLSSELLDSRFIHVVSAGYESLAHVQVFQIQSWDVLSGLGHGIYLREKTLSITSYRNLTFGSTDIPGRSRWSSFSPGSSTMRTGTRCTTFT